MPHEGTDFHYATSADEPGHQQQPLVIADPNPSGVIECPRGPQPESNARVHVERLGNKAPFALRTL